MSIGTTIAVIPAGERWPDGTLRVAIEDMIGAGAIIAHLQGKRSPESEAAERVFQSVQKSILTEIQSCSSGKELIARGCGRDIEIACDLNASVNVPVLRDGCYSNAVNLRRNR
jgi:2-phosphosulfolactate phosphatase